jgi:hypothetical protein
MSEAQAAPPVDPMAGGVSARPHPVGTGELDFVAPWADQPNVLIDLTNNEAEVRIRTDGSGQSVAARGWLEQLEEARAEIAELREEIRRLRSGA